MNRVLTLLTGPSLQPPAMRMLVPHASRKEPQYCNLLANASFRVYMYNFRPIPSHSLTLKQNKICGGCQHLSIEEFDRKTCIFCCSGNNRFAFFHENNWLYLEAHDCPGSHSIWTRPTSHLHAFILHIYMSQAVFTGGVECRPPSVASEQLWLLKRLEIGSADC